MGKKVALFILGLALVLGLFALYQYLSGTDPLGGTKPKVRLSNPTTLPMYWEERDANGVLQYVITAAKSPELLRDDAGNPRPGQFLIEKPLATIYRGGRVIQISADRFRAVIEQAPSTVPASARPKNAASASASRAATKPKPAGPLGGKLTIRGGELEGHVRLMVTPKPGAAATAATQTDKTDPLADGFRVYCDGILELDNTQEIMTTKGGVHLRSADVDFDGWGMQLIVSLKEERIDYLGIERGDKIVLRGVGAKFTEVSNRTAGGTSSGRSTAMLPDKPGKKSKPPVTYRLTFAQDIKTGVKTASGESTLTGDRLYLLFMAAGGLLGDSGSETKTATEPATKVALAPAPLLPGVLLASETAELIAPAKENDLVVNWSGPMEIRPADDSDLKLATANDIVLEALGTALKPVTITDPRFNAQSGRLWYHQDEDRLVLDPRDFKKVILSDSGHGTTEFGNVQCAAVTMDLKANHALLTGPGTLLAAKTATTVTWKTRMDLDMESVPDAKDPTKKTLVVRHAVLDGVTVKSATVDLKANMLDVLIANVLDKGNQVPALERLLATGDVVVRSFRKGTGVEQGGMQTQRMEVLTAKGPDSAVPAPSQLTAQGNVLAWRYVDKNKGERAGVTTVAATVPGGALQKETIVAPKLVANLAPKPKTDGTAAGAGDIAGIGQDFDVTRFIASDGVRVEIIPPAGSKTGTIIATATTIDGQPLAGTAALSAAGGSDPVRVAIGENAVEGRTITLDNNKRSFTVPGAGVFKFTLPADKNRKTATPLVITWQGSMTFDDLKHLAVFTGKPVARVLPAPGSADRSDQARLQCDNALTVQLKPAASGGASATTPAASIGGMSQDLDWILAEGNVEAYGAQVGPDNKPLTSLLLKAPGTLRYSKAGNSFLVDGPGTLAIENNRPDKPDARMSTAGQSGFTWQGSLKYDGDGNTITFVRNVKFVFLPTKAFKFSSTIPGVATRPGPREPDVLELYADQLVCQLTASADATSKAIDGPIAFDKQEVSHVDAAGNARCVIGTWRLVNGAPATNATYLISADTMTFDVPTNVATMIGNPAVLQRPGIATGSTRRIKIDLTKDKKFFEVEQDWQGNLAAFGG